MAIEKMALVSIEGPVRKVNRTLTKCCESGIFHIIPSVRSDGKETETPQFKTLKTKNRFAPVLKRAGELAKIMGIDLTISEHGAVKNKSPVDFEEYFGETERSYKEIFGKIKSAQACIKSNYLTLTQIGNMKRYVKTDLAKIYGMRYIKVRFGRMPKDSEYKLPDYENKNFFLQRFETSENYVWCVYFCPTANFAEIDDVFQSLYFERIRIPDFIKDNPNKSSEFLQQMIEEERESLDIMEDELVSLKKNCEKKFAEMYHNLAVLNDSFEIRANVAVMDKHFFLAGYIPKKNIKNFGETITSEQGVSMQIMPGNSAPTESVPVSLKNNALFKPFEMFIKMYGLPAYGMIDPTPLVAITYMLFYGIMFGDLGQGLFVAILGYWLCKKKNFSLGVIMTRVGVCGAIFGTLYGSVFGQENIITPFFKKEAVYLALGLNSPPEDIFHMSSYLLLFSFAIGIIMVLVAMIFNIVSSIRKRNIQKGVFSVNGIVGMVFYVAIVAGGIMKLDPIMAPHSFTPPYLIAFVFLPLILLFFKEPICDFIEERIRENARRKIKREIMLVEESRKNSVSEVQSAGAEFSADKTVVQNTLSSIANLVKCKFFRSRYGKMKIEDYNTLSRLPDRRFSFIPVGSDDKYVTGAYVSPNTNFAATDSIMSLLGFETADGETLRAAKPLAKPREKKSVGNFILENAIELFESLLSYFANTMSFLRIGGFVLGHAGLMMVVGILAGMAGKPLSIGWFIVEILGNLFVIGMEGFLVGIQALRLEFYEIFGRFYETGGKPFSPISSNASEVSIEN